MNHNAPVLLIVFNRPETTQKVFDVIKKAKPKKLYISADAPRMGNINDEKDCNKVKEIVAKIDWECETHYRFSEINQGCGPGPFNAISWAFEKEDKLIILEDDCVPALPFFNYCDTLLQKYKDDTRIWLISGTQYSEEAVTTGHSYFFSKYGHSGGWATWKRCWTHMDMEMKKYPLFVSQDLFKSAYHTKSEADFFKKAYNRIYTDKFSMTHIWDFQFGFALLSNNHMCIVPNKNLITNIGYLGTHSNKKEFYHDRPIDNEYYIKSHPDFVLLDVEYDMKHFKKHWLRGRSIWRRLINKFLKIVCK